MKKTKEYHLRWFVDIADMLPVEGTRRTERPIRASNEIVRSDI